MATSFFIGALTGSIATVIVLVMVGFRRGYIRVSLNLDKTLGKKTIERPPELDETQERRIDKEIKQ